MPQLLHPQLLLLKPQDRKEALPTRPRRSPKRPVLLIQLPRLLRRPSRLRSHKNRKNHLLLKLKLLLCKS
jgi:hypothetical protein